MSWAHCDLRLFRCARSTVALCVCFPHRSAWGSDLASGSGGGRSTHSLRTRSLSDAACRLLSECRQVIGPSFRLSFRPGSPSPQKFFTHPQLLASWVLVTSGCQCLITRHQAGHWFAVAAVPVVRLRLRHPAGSSWCAYRWASIPEASARRSGLVPEPGMGGFTRDSSRVLLPSLSRGCRDCGRVDSCERAAPFGWAGIIRLGSEYKQAYMAGQ